MGVTAGPPERRYDAPEHRPGTDHPVPVTIVDGVLLVLWSILGQVVVVVALGLAGVDLAAGGPSVTASAVLAQSVVLAGALAWLSGRGALTWRLLGPRPAAGTDVLRGTIVGTLGVALTTVVVLVAGLFTEVEPADQALLNDALSGGLQLGLSVVAAVVMAPLIEELVFRGVLFQAVGRRFGLVAGMITSGIVFAAVHVEVPQAPQQVALAALGAWFAWSFHRTRSLVVPVVAHATFNAIQLALALTLGR